jgi:peptidoglycan/LPS O-acetylase OafA/YrhL
MPAKYPFSAVYVPPLTGIRALAALMVLGLHADQNIPAGATSVLPFLARGYLGVDFFFVLSGFIITHVYLTSLAKASRNAIRIFLWHRFIRLYPVHVTVLVALVGVIYLARAYHVTLNNPEEWRGALIPWHLLLLHAWGVIPKPGWNGPSWSISAEWFAYLLFPLVAPALMLVRNRFTAISLAIAVLTSVAAIFSIANWSINTWVGLPALARVLGEFLCGAALCRAVALDHLSPQPALAPGHRLPPIGDLLGATAFLLFLVGASAGLPDFSLVGLLALTILGTATANSFLARLLGSGALVWLGEISYSIYMVHFPILLVIRRLWDRTGILERSTSARAAAYALTVMIVIGMAALLFYLVERPARMRLRDQMGKLMRPGNGGT